MGQIYSMIFELVSLYPIDFWFVPTIYWYRLIGHQYN